ncbi:MAG: protein kinase [Limisphaerales bacterium]
MKFLENEFRIELEGPESNRDYIQLSDGEWLLKSLQPGSGSGKGKNSCVFRAVHPEGGDDVIVKFCRFPHGVQGDDEIRRRKRFSREMEALRKAYDAKLGEFLITFFESGECQIGKRSFLYYVMEEADYDLAEFLEKNTPTLQQKMLLCSSILRALWVLHEQLGIYHRDLKPDNIFFVDDQWKIGDLGFIGYRGEDEEIDAPRERIGPTGLMSPEAINKAFSNYGSQEFQHECGIDELSDVYQLGGVFWYILQGNLPTGQLAVEDFKIGNRNIFSKILMPMLQHSKTRRATIPTIQSHFNELANEVAL